VSFSFIVSKVVHIGKSWYKTAKTYNKIYVYRTFVDFVDLVSVDLISVPDRW